MASKKPAKSVSFFQMSKDEQLSVLGGIYTKLLTVGQRRVNLDLIHTLDTDIIPKGCGSAACVVGWAATDRSVADRLGVRLADYDLDLQKYVGSSTSGSLELVRLNPAFKDKPVQPARNSTHISCQRVFQEPSISSFLFSARTGPENRWSHFRVALARLLYLGHLIDSGLNLAENGWIANRYGEPNEHFLDNQRAAMMRNEFVVQHLQKLKAAPTAKPAVNAIG